MMEYFDYRIFVVDDDNTLRLLLGTMLGARYAVEMFANGAECLKRIEASRPDLVLLDVGLPDIDGYDVCRRIKANPTTAAVPVVFLSGHDHPEDILAGYDAGGQDYVVKPFDVAGLHHKIERLQRIEAERRSLAEQAQASDQLASLVLANLDEYAILIKFLRALNECETSEQVVDAMLRVLDAFHLDGAVQLRLRDFEKTYGRHGENWPLEIAVINHVRTLERIFEFKQRAAYNFDRVTVLINNMPVADAELCGRIRDNLAIATESADAKLGALQTSTDKTRLRDEIHGLLSAVDGTVESYGRKYDAARYQGSVHTTQFLDDLLAAFAHLGLSAEQEETIIELARTRSEELVDLYDIAGDTHRTLADIGARMESLLEETT